MTNRVQSGRVTAHVVMIGLSALAIFPVYWMVQTSFRAPNDVFATDLWPSVPTFQNYRDVMDAMPIFGILWNTFVMAATTTIAQIATGVLAAWALVRWKFPGGRLAHSLIALSWLVPFQVVMIPHYVLATKLGLMDSVTGLVLPNAAAALAVLVLYNAMRGFPREVVEAARLDGANSFRTLVEVVLPNLRAPIASISILCFISAWNEYFWPLLLIRKIENSVVQIGLQFFMTQEGNDWGLLMAAATMASLPILLIYLVLQRQVVESFMKSGIR